MTTEAHYSEGIGYLIAEVSGQRQKDDIKQIIENIRDEANRRGLTRLLIDIRNLLPPINDMDRFYTG